MKNIKKYLYSFTLLIAFIHFLEFLNFSYHKFPVLVYVNLLAVITYIFFTYYFHKTQIEITKGIKILIIASTIFIFIHLLYVWKGFPEIYLWVLTIFISVLLFFRGESMLKLLLFTLVLFSSAPLISEIFDLNTYYLKIVKTNPDDHLKLLYLTNILITITILYTIFSYHRFTEFTLYQKKEKRIVDFNKYKVTKTINNNNDIQEEEEEEEDILFVKLFNKIENYLKNEKPYLDPEYTLKKLSLDVGSNTTYVSKSINLKNNSNFNDYINKYRVNYFKEIIIKNDYTSSLPVKRLYLKSGFKHQSTFNRVFKQFEGITPSQFINENS